MVVRMSDSLPFEFCATGPRATRYAAQSLRVAANRMFSPRECSITANCLYVYTNVIMLSFCFVQPYRSIVKMYKRVNTLVERLQGATSHRSSWKARFAARRIMVRQNLRVVH
jgi:hypothetical protein